ncbi:MAG: protein kinase [Myxococcaceae bacterium]|nr:protein kinase [Myxococcaceae bacterium]
MDKVLGRGGMGEVLLGFDTSLQRPVAIKVIRSDLAQRSEFVDRFVREARAQAQIAHSNVVQVYYIGQEQDAVYIVMELVDGGCLADFLEPAQRLPWEEAARHMLGLAEGLGEAARLNIIHRDIKPHNILLDRFGLAHLADFGLAAPVNTQEAAALGEHDTLPSPALPKLTMVGAIMGSPAYMSPEQARGEALDARSDIYGLGATFYELLTGQPANRGDTLQALREHFAGPPPPKIRQHAPKLPMALAEVIDRCLEHDKTRRFQDYAELVDALKKAQPKPIIPATVVSRVLSWALDVSVFAVVTAFTRALFPLLGFGVLVLWVMGGIVALGATPAQWMMRLALRRPPDNPVSPLRGLMRFLLQHVWLAFGILLVSSVYESASETVHATYALLTVTFALLGLGGAGAALFSKERRTLVDRMTRTVVLVDVR